MSTFALVVIITTIAGVGGTGLGGLIGGDIYPQFRKNRQLASKLCRRSHAQHRVP